jgi:hypothetical protein
MGATMGATRLPIPLELADYSVAYVATSIPPLATIQINISNQEVASERMDFLSNTCAGVQYFGPLFA